MKSYDYKKEKIERVKSNLLDNFTYKAVALFIALILWVSILNRRDFIASKDIEVNFITSAEHMVLGQSVDKLRIKVSGPQPLLKKFKESSQMLNLDLVDKNVGLYDVEMQASKIEIPKGIKLIAIRPSYIRVEIANKNQ